MSAAWRAARAAVRRRRMQTVVIATVVFFSTATIMVALGLLAASSEPFARAFAQQNGAHVTATFDSATVDDTALDSTAKLREVEDAAGPFGQTGMSLRDDGAPVDAPGKPYTVVGRGEPAAGSIDEVDLWTGRWATEPGEIVLSVLPGSENPGERVGTTLTDDDGRTFTVVGTAYGLSHTADAWVAPEQMSQLGATETQMLYRFAEHDTAAELTAALTAVTDELPTGSLITSQSYLVIKDTVAAGPGKYLPFLMVFGILGMLVAILVVVNVVSGAVVAGFRHIGVLKAIGFTPRQVMAVYLMMVSVPAAIGSVIGAAAGIAAQQPILSSAFRNSGLGAVTVSPWVVVATMLGMPTIVVIAALAPALRARRLSPAAVISAGSAPRTGRGMWMQRRLAGMRLPRAVSLGLGLPFARPARTVMTLAAIVLGVTTVTFTTGLTATIGEYSEVFSRSAAVQAIVESQPEPGGEALGDSEVETLLEDLPETAKVTADLVTDLHLSGYSESAEVEFLRGDTDTIGYQEQLTAGRWFDTAGEAVVTSSFAHQRDVSIGDRLTMVVDGSRTQVTVVGQVMGGTNATILTDWSTYTRLDTEKPLGPITYQVGLAEGTSVEDYATAVAEVSPQLRVEPSLDEEATAAVAVLFGLVTLIALMLGTVAALGVFHTVVLNTRERRRDFGMLKSIGMTPRQVIAMVVTSMAALGVVGGLAGLGLGTAAHRAIIPFVAKEAQLDFPVSLLRIWSPAMLIALAATGVVIAVCGAYFPARSAGRLKIAEVLHTE